MMIRNYFKIAWRSLLRYKVTSLINLFGLTVGLCCCFLILGYILHELSYDSYHQNSHNVYRVERSFSNPETGMPELELGTLAPPFGSLLENDFEEIQTLTRVFSSGNITLNYEEKTFNEQKAYFADENFFDVFDVAFINGNAENALNEPYNVILTEEIAEKYFGNEDPLNKTIRLDNSHSFKVAGVYKAFPDNSHFHPQLLLSFKTLHDPEIYGEENLRNDWGNNSFYTYIILPENYDANNLESRFPAFLDRHMNPEDGAGRKASDWTSLELTPLTDIHLHSQKDLELEENGDITRVYIFSAIALFILIIACINYMNLSTARSVLRAKEIGVRKVMGADKKQLVFQFLSESVLLLLAATVFAFILCWLAFPFLNQLTGQNLSIHILFQWQLLPLLLLLPFVVGILSGLYPALVLSSFRPVQVLKGFFKIGGEGVSLREALVVFQFSISIVLIISTLVIYQQLQYMQNKSLGFEQEQIVTFPVSAKLSENFETFRSQLLSNTMIKNVSRSSRIPSNRLLDGKGASIKQGEHVAPANTNIRYVLADDDFLSTYNIPLVEGRDFSRNFGKDTSAFIINEAAARELRIESPEEAIGKGFIYGDKKGQLVGVVQDFHFESLHQRILPTVFYKGNEEDYNFISVKISGENAPAALAELEKTWNLFDPETPVEYSFLDDRYANLYISEKRQRQLFTLFACIAIAIACLGLFGLSAFTINRRVREIGIRKVLGAENSSILMLLSKDFLKLVLVSAFIAFPVAWYIMNSWLEDFAYRIDIPWWIFVLAGFTAILVSLITISFQAIKASTSNPVKNLRTE